MPPVHKSSSKSVFNLWDSQLEQGIGQNGTNKNEKNYSILSMEVDQRH